MVVADHERFIRQCYELAEASVRHGSEPFGSLLVRDGEVVLTAENSVGPERNPTRHAETNLVHEAIRRFGIEGLKTCTLYTSTEPCVMCCGTIYWAGIPRVVFGVPVSALAKLTGFDYHIDSRDVFARMGPRVEVEGPVLEDEGMSIHRSYWT